MKKNESIQDLVTEYVYKNFLENMPVGKKIRINSVDPSFAVDLAISLRKIAHQNFSESEMDTLVIAVIDEEAPDENLRISIPKAIEYRNRKSRILYIVPDTVGAAAESIGSNAFDSKPMLDIYKGVVSGLESKLQQIEQGDQLLRVIRRNLPKSASSQAVAELLLETLSSDEPVQSFGKNLWRVGLIPDSGSQILERIPSNAKVCGYLSGHLKPLSGSEERLISAGLSEGKFRDDLAKKLVPLPRNFATWLRDLPEDEYFEFWPISSERGSDFEGLEANPFILAEGKVDPRCKLKLDPLTGALVAESKVSVYWSTKPTVISSVKTWLLELVPPSGIQDEYPVLRSLQVTAGKRMGTIGFQLSEEERDTIAPRYVVRVSAVDTDGQIMALTDGNLASVESQEFILDENPSEEAARVTNARSIPEAILQKALDGRDKSSEAAPSWDIDGQVFSLSISAFDKIQMGISKFIIAAQREAARASRFPKWHVLNSISGTEASFEECKAFELDIPPNLLEKRRKFLALLETKDPSRNTIETASWSEDLKTAGSQYLVSYRKALENAERKEELVPLLLLETVTVKTKLPHGEITGVVLLPTHPLRLTWVAEHDELLRSWASSLAGVRKSFRSQEIDFKLTKKISPANLPFLVLGGTDFEDLRAFTYIEELTHGAALYLDAASAETKVESIAIRRVIGLSNAVLSDASNSAELVGDRMHRYAISHAKSPGIRTLIVNPADADIPANAARQLFAKLGEQASGLKMEFVGYGSMTSYANPMSQLATLQAELDQDEGSLGVKFRKPTVHITNRNINSLTTDEGEAHIAIVQGFTSPTIARTHGHSGLSATLKGLLTPTQSYKWESAGNVTYFTKPAIECNNSKKSHEIIECHAEYLGAMGLYLFGQKNIAGLELHVDPTSLDRLRAAHSRADWVLTLDRNLGLSLYEDLIGESLGGAYVLDYAPDFIDGLGDRLTVTTTRQAELQKVISRAMDQLGLVNEGLGAPELLRTLASVSGRLALRLLGEDTSATEALGLSATITHLRKNGDLINTVIIPVDAHLDLFGAHARKDELSAERCDVILVRFKQRSHSVEFVEVKARSSNVDHKLFKDMAFQVDQTHDLLRNRLFGKESPRIDAELQWSRWCSLLHFYADRAALHGYIDSANLLEIHSAIDRIEITHESPSVTKTGYVVSLQGKSMEMPKEFETMQLHLLNSESLESLGFTTKFASTVQHEFESEGVAKYVSKERPDDVRNRPQIAQGSSEAEKLLANKPQTEEQGNRAGPKGDESREVNQTTIEEAGRPLSDNPLVIEIDLGEGIM